MTNKTPHPTRSPDREADERFYHLRNTSVQLDNGRTIGNVTAFIRRNKNDGQHYVSFAECDARDQFNRKVGRVVARRKWFNGKRQPLNAAPSYESVADAFFKVVL